MSGPALWNALSVQIRNAKTILTFRKLPKSHIFDQTFIPSPSAARLPVDEPVVASIMIMTHDHGYISIISKPGKLD